MPLVKLQALLQSVEPAAHLVEPLVLRRVVRLDRRLQGLRFVIPHDFSYTIDRDRLLAFVELDELAIPPGSDLPRRVILLSQPDDDELQDESRWPAIQERYCRLLFHACVHLQLDNHLARDPLETEWVNARKLQIGDVEFSEIHDVLLKENLLFQPPSDAETYIEFAAHSLELKYFAPAERPIYYPGIRNWNEVDHLLQADVDHEQLFQRIQQIRGSHPGGASNAALMPTQTLKIPRLLLRRDSLAVFRQLMAKAAAAAELGNSVKGALTYLRASRQAPSGHEAEAQAAADRELVTFSQRLQRVFQLTDDEAEQWRVALQPLLLPAVDGFWSTEARLLYDLQKVCSEQERGVYRVDLIDWIRTFGRRPLRRSLPLMQDALTLRHLRTVQRRIALARISPGEQAQLAHLLEGVLPRIETRSRDRLRQIINDVFDEVGFIPHNVLEVVARRKLVEELLDRIVERSYFNLGDLRDAISKNDLKLADVTTLSALVFGDCVLKADRRFDTVLDGIYRRGAIYLRWPQTLSSMAFGTNFGRMLTRHLFIPFGGAYLLIEFLHHMALMITGEDVHAEAAESVPVAVEAAPQQPDLLLWSGVILLGTWISLLIQRPEFRAWNVAVLTSAWRMIRHVVVDLPSQLVNSDSVQKILASRTFSVLRSYVLEPGLLVSLMTLFALIAGRTWDFRTILDIYLVTALFLNSPVGRWVSERTVDLLVRAWQEFKMHIFAAMVQWIVDVFDWLLVALERVVYTVDEWLRFRTGDDRAMRWVKLAGGVVWFFVSYVVVFIFTLLVEPQINPLKHFPVVTVSHKLILPALPEFVRKLTPYLGKKSAQTLVFTTIWLIPGVFGFLVWELKENWRLYAANRPKKIGAEPIGHHGETMLRLLRPGFHSGTLPKSFATLRRFMKKGSAAEESRIQRKRAGILHVEEAVQHFVERELIALLEEVPFLPETQLQVRNVHAATNRIELELLRADQPEDPARLTWEYSHGQLVGKIDPAGWIDQLSEEDFELLKSGLEQLFQLAGVQNVEGQVQLSVAPPIVWEDSVTYWTRARHNSQQPVTI
ncbi:hypothetical protein SH661x_000779 [Planctomicrobium sp. SH661]|uniref:hypothetical protein n=1 Tax=Planctomicrobium sp. SH661 TaxID=3448124 RepID=UPI003F5B7125